MLYVPENYGHAVVNLDDTLAVAIEILHMQDNSQPEGGQDENSSKSPNNEAAVTGTIYPPECSDPDKQRSKMVDCIQNVPAVNDCIEAAGSATCTCLSTQAFSECTGACWPWLMNALCPDQHQPEHIEVKGGASNAKGKNSNAQQYINTANPHRANT